MRGSSKHGNRFLKSVFFLIVLSLMLFSLLAKPASVVASGAAQAELPVIEVNESITADTTWPAGFVYYVTSLNVEVASNATLTIEPGVIVKFEVPPDPAASPSLLRGLTIKGNLVIQGTNATPVIFASGRNDAYGGDTNGDGSQTNPGLADWLGLTVENRSSDLTGVIVQNAQYGLRILSSTTQIISPAVLNNTFSNNQCGLTFFIQGTYNLESLVQGNRFSSNRYGLCTMSLAGKTGASNIVIKNNAFDTNLVLPIFINGTAYPNYEGNTFVGYAGPSGGEAKERHLGIGLGGTFYKTGTFQKVPGYNGTNLPYVVIEDMTIEENVTVEFLGGTTVKFYTKYDFKVGTTVPTSGKGLTVKGTLALTSDASNPITFTSYRDDDPAAGGDTNGDGEDTTPYAGDWKQVLYTDSDPITNETFSYLNFRYAENGLHYKVTTASSRSPVIRYSNFHGNLNGLRLVAASNQVASILTPVIENCSFSNHGIIPKDKTQKEPGVPILLENTVNPSYTNNTFTDNLHPAIGVMGIWRSSVTWTRVDGQGLSPMPYLVHGTVKLGNYSNVKDDTATFTIPERSVIKFNVNVFDRNYQSSIQSGGKLSLESNADTGPIVFTSYYDNDFGGSTSGDATLPTRTDWLGVYVRHPDSDFNNTIFRYGEEALHIQQMGNQYEMDNAIVNSTFEQNQNGLYLDIQHDSNITSTVENCAFIRNSYGLTTFAKNTETAADKVLGISIPTLRSNRFEEHSEFPIYLNGSASPIYVQDTSGNPTNIFDGNIHRAIALGGYFGSSSHVYQFPRVRGDVSGVFAGKTFPYVVLQDTYFDWQTSTQLAGGLIFKFDLNKTMEFMGRFEMATSAAAGNGNVFTSYRDDSDDDTNGTPTPNPAPAPGAWKGLYLANPATPGFAYATVKYSKWGVVIYQQNSQAISPFVSYNRFEQNESGLTLWIDTAFNITSLVNNNSFIGNDYGLHTYTNDASKTSPTGSSNPILKDNHFTEHTEFPIYLQGSSNPVYEGNVFWSNIHKGIALSGYWFQNATWTRVPGDSEVTTVNHYFPYVIIDDLVQSYSYTVSLETPEIIIPAGTVIKILDGKYVYAYGLLKFMSTPTEKIYITSYNDDTYAGDTNASTVVAKKSAWKSIWLIDYPGKTNDIHDVVANYGQTPFAIYYDGPVNTEPITKIRDSEFSNGIGGVLLALGWRTDSNKVIHGGEGNIKAELKNLVISDSDYGLLTMAHNKTTGIIKPTLENIQFINIAKYPMFLGGTSYPTFVGTSQIISSSLDLLSAPLSDDEGEEPEQETALELKGLDLPGNAAVLDQIQPGEASLSLSDEETSLLSGSLVVAGSLDLSPAIGIAGSWNNTGSLPAVSVPYAITGAFPVTLYIENYANSYTPADNVTIGETNPSGGVVARVTVPAGTIFKFGHRTSKPFGMVVKGGLNLLSTASTPVIFTSIHDDSAGGDTNRNGSATASAKGNWDELQLNSSYTEFKYAIVRYATDGLHLFLEGGVNQNIHPIVRDSIFTENTNGLTLTAKTSGDVFATVTRNRFVSNTIHILGNVADTGFPGRLCVEAHENDLLGNSSNQNGVENRNINTQDVPEFPNCAFNATQNYWGDGSGPYNSTLNPNGRGSRVSTRVIFNPWKGAAIFTPSTYSVTGRVTLNAATGAGVAGVRVTLGPSQITATTDQDGYYRFDNLSSGNYTVYASMAGYQFTPPQIALQNVQNDISQANFVAIPSSASVTVSINSVKVLRPRATGRAKFYARFTVTLNKLPDAGTTVTVKYRTTNGSAVSGTTANGGDYTSKTGTLTFLSGANQPLTKTIDVEILPGNGKLPAEFFTVELYDPVGTTFVQQVGGCDILPRFDNFMPYLRK